MKALWIADISFPEVYATLGKSAPVHAGWVYSAAQNLLKYHSNVELGMAVIMDITEMKVMELNGVKHYLLPSRARGSSTEWKEVLDDFRPDVVHVHGTEYPYLYDFISARSLESVVLSIQGLVSVYERYYYGSIPLGKICANTTLRDIVRWDTLMQQKWNMKKRGVTEQRAIRSVDAVIGRTDWDKVHTFAINSKAKYFHNDETLRVPFYTGVWQQSSCQRYRIFVSQAHYPIKGLHQLLKALPQIVSKYPDTELHIAGHDFFNNRGIKISGYGKYINRMISKLGLQKHIHFTGLLNAEEMKQQYLQAHVFVCPSAIENSPNSVGEAQMLGTPVVAAYVGGIPSMVTHNETGLLYRFEEPEQLAAHIMMLFEDKDLCQKLSEAGRSAAATRHNPERNAEALLEIYESLKNMNGNGS